ncbi:EsaB/YukD family protein [Xylocopilactobacillus apicola]|uniref:Type VII secretion protein, YukD family n=1 Tax=Xylocopilactobacillus apicola TaxID=2932184 RepID=A0AAU9DLL7_9LACO|nr:EsaB/YukD family protein [Xylocopilactobacillus apicola]BDR59446.1 hypothetical protein XA3_18870 [Xylocopilactobacillus apicola]
MSYINVTIKWVGASGYVQDLRIPTNITVNKLIAMLIDGLNERSIDIKPGCLNIIKVTTKDILISGTDILRSYPIADGDILEVI